MLANRSAACRAPSARRPPTAPDRSLARARDDQKPADPGVIAKYVEALETWDDAASAAGKPLSTQLAGQNTTELYVPGITEVFMQESIDQRLLRRFRAIAIRAPRTARRPVTPPRPSLAGPIASTSPIARASVVEIN